MEVLEKVMIKIFRMKNNNLKKAVNKMDLIPYKNIKINC
jgi:hypothetical protein